MTRLRHLLPVLIGALALAAPAAGQATDRGGPPPPAGGRTRDGAPAVDPRTDPVVVAIRGAVSPNAQQMERIVALLTNLRQKQVEMRRQTMRAARGEAQKRIEELNKSFLADCRALLQPDQHQGWDTVAPTLDLTPPRPDRRDRGRREREEVRGPAEGSPAPDFELTDLKGRTVSLSSLRGRPIVIEFGSYTCPVFRGHSRELEALRKEHGDSVAWVLVYTREAHPSEEGPDRDNLREGIEVPQHTTFEGRLEAARTCAVSMDLKVHVLVDGIDNKVTELYAGWPNRGYVIDAKGVIISRQNWIDPKRTREILDRLRRG